MSDNNKKNVIDETWYDEILKDNKKYYSEPIEYGNGDIEPPSADPSKDSQYYWLQIGEYIKYFEEMESYLHRKPNVYDCHRIYLWILREIRCEFSDWIIGNKLECTLSNGKKINRKLSDIEISLAIEREQDKLDKVFDEFVLRLYETDNVIIKSLQEKLLHNNISDFIAMKHNDNSDKKNENHLTDLQEYLIKKRLLFNDGKRVIKNLYKVAEEIVIFTNQLVTSQFLLENFRTRQNKEYSPNSCDNARDFANKQ